MLDYGPMDLSRTVGCFAENWPALIRVDLEIELPTQLGDVARQVQSPLYQEVPFYLPRYIARDADIRRRMAAYPIPELALNYFGRYVPPRSTGSLLNDIADEPSGTQHSGEAMRRFVLLVYVQLADGRLLFLFQYSDNLHRRETIQRLVDLMLGDAARSAEILHT